VSHTLRVGLWLSTFVLLVCTSTLFSGALPADSPVLRTLYGGVWAAGLIQLVLAPVAVVLLVRRPGARSLLNYTLTGMGVLGAVLFLRMWWLAFQ